MRSPLIFSLVAVAVMLTAACNRDSSAGTAHAALDQANLCEVSSWRHDEVAEACKPGQKVVFLPNSFGNEQLPVVFAAVNCDLRYTVALTNGGVTCIYGPVTPESQ